MTMQPATQEIAAERRWLWIGLLAVASVLLSGMFACATPFAALAALAALDINRRDGLFLVGAIWIANQIWGYAVLGYPHDATTAGWGLAIGAGAVVAFLCARAAVAALPHKPLLVAVSALVVAFIAYEAVLYGASFVLGDGHGAFTAPVIGRLAAIDAIAFVVLLGAHRLAVAVRLVERNAIEARAVSLPDTQRA